MKYIGQAYEAMHLCGDGSFTRKCHRVLESELGVPKALLTTSGTHALEMAAMLLDLQPGDEVIVPSFTFPSVVNAFIRQGAKPVFADVRPDTLNLDESRLPALITSATRAIVPVHYAGVGCEMDSILSLADAHGIRIIEDNAHGLFGRYRGKPLGTFGSMAAQSFHETKNFSCGEGGALLINRPNLIKRAEIIREKGTNRKQFFEGKVEKYTWVDIGSSYLPSEILAAILYAQFEIRDEIQTSRRECWLTYRHALADWAQESGVALPFVPGHCEQAFHIFYLILPDARTRSAFIQHLRAENILAVFHYMPLHLSAMGRKFGGFAGQCPVSERVSECLVRLPLYSSLTASDQQRVIEAIQAFDVFRAGVVPVGPAQSRRGVGR